MTELSLPISQPAFQPGEASAPVVGPAVAGGAFEHRDDRPLLAVRSATRRLVTMARERGHLRSGALAVAVSGGADSLALAAGAEYVARRAGLRLHGFVVDHGLQPGSALVARRTVEILRELGLPIVEVLTVRVDGPGGVEAAARRARYAALRSALPARDALVLLGHTRDDQAETVLLGLGRGSGPRSIAGMRPLDPPWARPLLALSRTTTVAACRNMGLTPWEDPHNADPRFTRVRLRTEVLPLLEAVLAGGVADALSRTAAQLREDGEALDEWAGRVYATARDGRSARDDPAQGAETANAAAGGPGPVVSLAVRELVDVPPAVRRRVLRRWLLDAGVRELTDAHLRAVDELVGAWRGQGGVWLAGGLVVRRVHGRLLVDRTDRGRTY